VKETIRAMLKEQQEQTNSQFEMLVKKVEKVFVYFKCTQRYFITLENYKP
jgi:hypothetical protein